MPGARHDTCVWRCAFPPACSLVPTACNANRALENCFGWIALYIDYVLTMCTMDKDPEPGAERADHARMQSRLTTGRVVLPDAQMHMPTANVTHMLNPHPNQAGVITDLVLLSCVGIRCVLVHGGGPEINSWLAKVGIEAVFKNGLRVTDGERTGGGGAAQD